jgi:hypothetical protein
VGAVRERVAEASIGGVEDLGEARGARRAVGEHRGRGGPVPSLARIVKACSPTGIHAVSIVRTVARGGALRRRAANEATAAAGPSTSTWTPRGSFATNPTSPKERASR